MTAPNIIHTKLLFTYYGLNKENFCYIYTKPLLNEVFTIFPLSFAFLVLQKKLKSMMVRHENLDR